MNEERQEMELEQEQNKERGKPNRLLRNKYAVGTVIAVLVIIAAFGAGYAANSNKNETVYELPKEAETVTANEEGVFTSEKILAVLSESAELTTMKYNISAIGKFTEEKGIIFLNKNRFSMMYRATVRAGINMSKVEAYVDYDNKKVTLFIPKAELQLVYVDPESIEFFDEKFTLIKTDEKENAVAAQMLAGTVASKEAEQSGILELADTHAELLIKGIISDIVPNDYEYIFYKK